MSSLRLEPGTWLLLDNRPYRIVAVEPSNQAVTLVDEQQMSLVVQLGWLLDHPGMETIGEPDPGPVTGSTAVLQRAPRHALTKANLRLQHVLEVETGYKSGDPLDGTVPDPRYDPVLVPSVTARRTAKAQELAQPAVDPAQRMSFRTLEREATEWRERRPENLVDGRSAREVFGTRVANEVLDAIEEVVAERKKRSNFQTLDGLAEIVKERVRKDHPEDWPELLPRSKRPSSARRSCCSRRPSSSRARPSTAAPGWRRRASPRPASASPALARCSWATPRTSTSCSRTRSSRATSAAG